MNLPGTVLAAAGAIEVFAALLFAFAFARRAADREYGPAAVVCLAAAAHAVGSLMAGDADGESTARLIADLGLLAALPSAIHFALDYRFSRVAPSWVAATYAIGGRAGCWRARRPAPPAGAEYAAAVAALAWTTTEIARAQVANRRGAVVVLLGSAALLATLTNDLGVTLGVLASARLADLGLAAFCVGLASTASARYASVTHELERRTEELRARTHELRRSYEDLRATQEELVKKEQLAMVGELAAVIAHEVRNPLAIIANAVAGLRKPAIPREDLETLLGILDEESTRLNRLVTDLLRYARPVNVQRSYVAIDDLLERALALANPTPKNIRTHLEVDVPKGRLWGDANLLRQVFENLIDNAVQAMTGGGTLTLQVQPAVVDGVDGLSVAIIDTGEGMDTMVRSRALDPFFTTRPSGTGLGLAIVDRFVEAHGGRLELESRSGEGTKVTVFLPHGSPGESPVRTRGRPSSQGPRRTVSGETT